ncbi:hypothetical protein [Nostoc sp.]|uniref:hypothetical protein n=1 Tax=Nostoc sp. TaxID=1180 RepID=UPI002FF79290
MEKRLALFSTKERSCKDSKASNNCGVDIVGDICDRSLEREAEGRRQEAGEAESSGNKLFSVNAPSGDKLYSVVSGKPLPQCPLEVQDTQINFFLDSDDASKRAKELDAQGYFIYVSPIEELRKKVLDALYDQYSSGSKNPSCFLVNGTTKKITVDFQNIYTLLPPQLQQPAREKALVFLPKNENEFLYVVNARESVS